MTDAQAALAQVRKALRNEALYDPDAAIYDTVDAGLALNRACNQNNMTAILAHVDAQEAEIKRLTAALQHEADCVEAAKAEIERLTEENRRLRADLLAGRNVVNAGLTIHTLTIERDMLRQEIERLTAALQYEQHRAGRQGTHGDGCADWGPEHYECAIRERDELRRQLDPMGEYASADELIAALRAEKAEDEAMKLDARRYRWLRNEANTARKCDPMVCIYPLDEQDLIDGDQLDVAIDAAMGLTRPAEEA